MWRKRNFCTQLVRMQVGAVTTKHSVTVPQKAKNRTTIVPTIPLLGILSLLFLNLSCQGFTTLLYFLKYSNFLILSTVYYSFNFYLFFGVFNWFTFRVIGDNIHFPFWYLLSICFHFILFIPPLVLSFMLNIFSSTILTPVSFTLW